MSGSVLSPRCERQACLPLFYPSRSTLNPHAYCFFLILQGYLRAGKALLLAEKPEKALDVYAYGLKTLGEQHPQKEVRAVPCLVLSVFCSCCCYLKRVLGGLHLAIGRFHLDSHPIIVAMKYLLTRL